MLKINNIFKFYEKNLKQKKNKKNFHDGTYLQNQQFRTRFKCYFSLYYYFFTKIFEQVLKQGPVICNKETKI